MSTLVCVTELGRFEFEIVTLREPWAICSECGAWLFKEQCGASATRTCCVECIPERTRRQARASYHRRVAAQRATS